MPSERDRKASVKSMTRLAIALIIAAVMMASFTPVAWAWGPGHEDVARAVFQYLPQDILKLLPPDAVQKAILTFSHYPDSFEPFQPDDIGLEAIQKLTDNGIKNRYGLHSDAGRAMAFVLLVDAFRERRYDHAAPVDRRAVAQHLRYGGYQP